MLYFILFRLGRRKSWLIPLQYTISIFLFILAFQVDSLFESKDVTMLTILFFFLNFLAASQDVAVDGWALTMLRRENVGYASTCNAVGQTLGFVLAYSGFLSLESPNFANKLRTIPTDYGLVTFPQVENFKLFAVLKENKRIFFYIFPVSSLLGRNICYYNNSSANI
jgi:PAT family acetyl-CoA transporter-like MFS transporter 1